MVDAKQVAKGVIIIWSFIIIIHDIVGVISPEKYIEDFFGERPLGELSAERARFLTIGSSLLFILTALFGLVTVKIPYNLKIALYFNIYTMFLVSALTWYQANQTEILGSKYTENVVIATIILLLGVFAWFVSTQLHNVDQRTDDIPLIVKAYFLLLSLYSCVASAFPGIVSTSSHLDLLFTPNPNETASERAQLTFLLFTFNVGLFSCGLATLYGFFNPHRLLIVWIFIFFATGVGFISAIINNADELGYSAGVGSGMLALETCFVLVSIYVYTKMPVSTIYMEQH